MGFPTLSELIARVRCRGCLSGLQSPIGLVRSGGHRQFFDPLFQSAVRASEARQAVGISRGAVVKPRTPRGAVHRLVLWAGGLSTAGAGVFILRLSL